MTVRYLDLTANGWSWGDYPSVGEAEEAMIGVAAGTWDEARVSSWLAPRLRPPDRP